MRKTMRTAQNAWQLHSRAFCDLETSLRDCVKMAEIAADLMLNARVGEKRLSFAVFHLAEMLTRLKKEYDARWPGEVQG